MLKNIILVIFIIWIIIVEIKNKNLKKKIKMQDTSFLEMSAVIKWMENKNRGFNVSKYLLENGYKSIAIYGMGDISRLLYEELKDSEVCVKCMVDRNYESMSIVENDIKVVSPDDIKDVDVVLVTPTANYNEVVEMIVNINPKLPTLSFRDAMFEIK